MMRNLKNNKRGSVVSQFLRALGEPRGLRCPWRACPGCTQACQLHEAKKACLWGLYNPPSTCCQSVCASRAASAVSGMGTEAEARAIVVREGFWKPRGRESREEGTPEGAGPGHWGLAPSKIQAA